MLLVLMGESGSGKSSAMNYIASKGFEKIKSHTTRLPRTELDDEYIFTNVIEYNKHKSENIIFEDVKFNDNYYWTLNDDYKSGISKQVLIVEPNGLKNIIDKFDCHIIYITSDYYMRVDRVGPERVARDEDVFDEFPCDYFIVNNNSLDNLYKKLDRAMKYFGII